MKKFILMLFLSFTSGVLAQTTITRVQQVIYDPNTKQEQQYMFSSSMSLGYDMYRINVALSQGGVVFSSLYRYTDLIFLLRDLANYNVIDMLEFEIDKDLLLSYYISRLDVSLLRSDLAISNLNEELSLLNYDIRYCSNQKTFSDKQYFDSIQYNYQVNLQQESLDLSKKYAQCISDSTIEYNAKKALLDKILFYDSIVKVKYDYLFLHKDNIVNYYNLIRDDLLEQLILIKKMLEKDNF